jgi:hypothetical protein
VAPVIGLIVFVPALVWASAQLERVRERIGPTWDDWIAADQIGGSWSPAVFMGSFLGATIVVFGMGVPDVIRALIAGVLLGWSLPFLLEGLRRFTQRDEQ